MTEAEERKRVDFEVYKFNHRMRKLNREMKHIRVTEVKVRINHPAPVQATMSWDVFARFREWRERRRLKAVNAKNGEA